MAFPAYQFMDIPESQAEDSDLNHQGIISQPISELLSTLPPIINSFLENVTIRELLAGVLNLSSFGRYFFPQKLCRF